MAAPAAAAPAPVATSAGLSEDEAKAAWLARLDAPTWGKAASTLQGVADDMVQMAVLEEKCDQGQAAACDTLSKEDATKKAWLAKLDVPSWGAAAADVPTQVATAAVAVATEQAVAPPVAAPAVDTSGLSAEEAAKRAWLAKQDNEPSWKRNQYDGSVQPTGLAQEDAGRDIYDYYPAQR